MRKIAKWVGFGFLGLIVLSVIASALGVESDTADEPAGPATTVEAVAELEVDADEDASVVLTDPVETTAAPESDTSGLTPAQEQAVRSAENYLAFAGFSRQGLVDQLVFEEFAEADAVVAVDSLNVDWVEQARVSAANYLESQAFSCGGLVDQLVFEGFSDVDARAGAESTGIC